MARLNKYASINLNESYGKPDQTGSPNAGANSSTSSKSRLPTQGGMVVLTKPGRGLSTGPKSGRLGIPSPLNLPSLKREHSGNDTQGPIATSPPLPGWTKGSQGENLTGASAEKPGSGNSNVLSGGTMAGSLDKLTENLKSLSTSPAVGKPDVYAPPALRAIQANGGGTPRNLPPTPGEKAAVIRGEEFPTLQASLVRPLTPPQQLRQKESQQKQREKQQEMKEQQLRLQQLSHQQQEHSQKQFLDDPSQPRKGGLQLQPDQPLRPQVKQERPQKEVVSHLKQLGGSVDQNFLLASGFGDGTLSKSPPLVRLSHASNWADDERERIQNDDEREKGQNLKPQNFSPSVQVGQDSSSIDMRQSGHNNEKVPSWASIRRDNLTSRTDNTTKNSRDFRTSLDEDLKGSRSKDGSDSRVFLPGRESYISRGNSASKDSSFIEFGRKEGYSLQEDLGNEWSGPISLGKAVGPIREAVQGREGLHNRGWLGKEAYNRDARVPYGRDTRELYKRDVREPYNGDLKETYIRDNRETFNRDGRDTHTRDFREVHNVYVNTTRQLGYGNVSDDGSNARRAGFGDTMFPHGRGSFYGGGAAANSGFGFDARYSRRYGFHSTGGDHLHLREGRPDSASATSRGRYAEPSVAHYSADGMGFKRNRSPVLDPERGVYAAEFERLEDEQQKKSEEKVISEQEGLGYTASKSLQKGDDLQRPFGRGDQADTGRKLEEEKRLREDVKKQLLFEDERRKEAARRKLLELEERIAQRDAEGRKKGEVEAVEKMEDKNIDDASCGNSTNARQDLEEASLNLEYEEEAKGVVSERKAGLGWKELDLPSKLTRPSSASSSSSWTFRGAGEELPQEQDSSLGAAEGKFNQELKLVHPRPSSASSSSSWTVRGAGEDLSQEQDSSLGTAEAKFNQELKLVRPRPSSASSSSSWTVRGAGEELSQEQDSSLGTAEAKFNQELKLVRPKSPTSWRKEANANGNCPTSRLFSSPYIESGGFHRVTDGGNYKLF